MNLAVEEKIRQRAYEIWMSAGMAERDAAADWLEAERAIMNETAMPVAKRAGAKRAEKAQTVRSMADMASGELATPPSAKAKPKPKTSAAGIKTRAESDTKAPTASAAKPAMARRRTKTQA